MDISFANEVEEINNGQFGTDAIISIASTSTTKTIRGIFHEQFSLEEDFDNAQEAYEAWFECATADVTGTEQNDTLTIDSVDYNIEQIERQQSDFTILRLSK